MMVNLRYQHFQICSVNVSDTRAGRASWKARQNACNLDASLHVSDRMHTWCAREPACLCVRCARVREFACSCVRLHVLICVLVWGCVCVHLTGRLHWYNKVWDVNIIWRTSERSLSLKSDCTDDEHL